MKQEQYIEPTGFKGTTGEWDCGYGNTSHSCGIFTKKMLDEGLFESPICLISPIDKLDDTDKANAKLISQSKELAKALQEIIENAAPVPDYPGEYFLHKLSLENAKQALKEAGLTDK